MKQMKNYNPNTYNAFHAALAFLLFWVAMTASSYAIYFIIKVIQNSGKTIDDLAPLLCLESIIVALALALVTGIVSWIAKSNPISGGGFLSRKGLGVEKLMAAVGVCGMAVLLSPLANLFSWNFSVVREMFFEETATGIDSDLLKNTGLLFLYVFVLVPVLPAIFEELLFRGVIMRGFSEWGKTTGVVLSAAAFALAHGNTDQLVYQFLIGLAIGFLVTETRSLGVGMIAHFTNNFFVQVLAIVETYPSEWNNAEVYVAIVGIASVLIALVCFTAAFVYFGRRFLHSQKTGKKACPGTKASFVTKVGEFDNLYNDVVWYQTGKLLAREEKDCYFLSKEKSVKYNKKSKMKGTILFTAIVFCIAITRIFLAFFEIV